MDSLTVVRDPNGERILEGSRVAYTENDVLVEGVVTCVTDPDGDEVDGRPVPINPKVYVRWDGDEVEVDYHTAWDRRDWFSPEYECEELDVLVAKGEAHVA